MLQIDVDRQINFSEERLKADDCYLRYDSDFQISQISSIDIYLPIGALIARMNKVILKQNLIFSKFRYLSYVSYQSCIISKVFVLCSTCRIYIYIYIYDQFRIFRPNPKQATTIEILCYVCEERFYRKSKTLINFNIFRDI